MLGAPRAPMAGDEFYDLYLDACHAGDAEEPAPLVVAPWTALLLRVFSSSTA